MSSVESLAIDRLTEAFEAFALSPAMASLAAACAAHGETKRAREETKALRDEFALAALPALLTRHRADVSWSDVAPLAYRVADDMLKAREGGVS